MKTVFGIGEDKMQKTSSVFTLSEIYQQPATWEKTCRQIAEHKDELKKFIDQVVTCEDFDIVLTGAGTSEFVGNALFPHLTRLMNHKVKSYGTTDIVATPEAYLSRTKPTLLISFGRSGTSQESALKMLELTAGGVVTMYDTPLGFRHGPKSIINDDTITVVYLSDDPYTRQYEVDLIKEMSGQRKGNKIVAVMSKADDAVAALVDYTVVYGLEGEHENVLLGLDYILFGQCSSPWLWASPRTIRAPPVR